MSNFQENCLSDPQLLCRWRILLGHNFYSRIVLPLNPVRGLTSFSVSCCMVGYSIFVKHDWLCHLGSSCDAFTNHFYCEVVLTKPSSIII